MARAPLAATHHAPTDVENSPAAASAAAADVADVGTEAARIKRPERDARRAPFP